MRSILKKIFQLLIMLAIAYSGSFLMMEETSEKTEKTEQSEEALHSIYHASGLQRTILKKKKRKSESSNSLTKLHQVVEEWRSEKSDYNIDHIYLSSYLRLRFS